MTIQASGTISFSDLQTEWGDSGSISMSELYKDGGSIGVASSVLEVGSTTGPRGYYVGVGTNVNGSNYYWVPNSSLTGTITLSDFYGGRAS